METALTTELQSNMIISTAIAKSGMFPGIREASQALVKVLAGRELGLPPIYSMMKIHFIKGQLALSAEAMASLIKKSGQYDYRIDKLTDTECVLAFTENGKDVYPSRWSMDDSKRAGLLRDDSGWQKFPRAMLFARALSQGAHAVCPHVIGGSYTFQDFGADTDEQGNPVIAITDTTTGEIKEEDNPRDKTEATAITPKAKTEQKVPDTKPEIDWGFCQRFATALGLKGTVGMAKALGVAKCPDWAGTQEVALDKMLEFAHLSGQHQEWKTAKDVPVGEAK